MTLSFQHEALMYTGLQGFLEGTVPFIRQGLANDEPTLVVVDSGKIAALREALGGEAERVLFADMAEVGLNPARIIPRWREFADEHLREGQPIRGIGEPIWAARGAAELAECQFHERLLNVAFQDGPGWFLLCPYDTQALREDVVAEARRSHPVLARAGAREASGDYIADPAELAKWDRPLPPAPAEAGELAFGSDPQALKAVREAVISHATKAGVDDDAIAPFALAAIELATNSLIHGGGHGTIRFWQDNGSFVCEIRDAGQIEGKPLLGRERPTASQPNGRGLWLANQMCDLVQISSSPVGTLVRLHIAITP